MLAIYPNREGFPYEQLVYFMLHDGKKVDTGHWQAVKGVPNTRTIELQNVVLEAPIQPTPGSWAAWCEPNLPWAEDHFQERVSALPSNPGVQYKNWPWYKPEWEAQKEGQFSHTYMERFWARFARDNPSDIPIESRSERLGIRYRYGDLQDVLDLLEREPHTRQAYLPMFFPEDTGAHHGERIPCSLGWHFMRREDKLHCFYPMRSVDLVRYLRDDAYMAGRLVQWVLNELQLRASGPYSWDGVQPGSLHMFMSSLHIFEDELPALRRKFVADSKG